MPLDGRTAHVSQLTFFFSGAPDEEQGPADERGGARHHQITQRIVTMISVTNATTEATEKSKHGNFSPRCRVVPFILTNAIIRPNTAVTQFVLAHAKHHQNTLKTRLHIRLEPQLPHHHASRLCRGASSFGYAVGPATRGPQSQRLMGSPWLPSPIESPSATASVPPLSRAASTGRPLVPRGASGRAASCAARGPGPLAWAMTSLRSMYNVNPTEDCVGEFLYILTRLF